VALAAGMAVAVALSFGAFNAAPAHASALTQAQIQSIVSLLQSFGADQTTINNVQASLNGQPTSGTGGSTSSTGGSCPALSRDLQQGSTGADVKSLQQYLNSMSATQIAASGAGSPGMETMTFGPATKAAVIKLQEMLNVTPAAGYVGAKSRAAIAANCGGSTSSTGGTTTGGGTTTSGSGLTVMSAAQPANALAPNNASRIAFTKFTVSASNDGDVTLNSVTVQRQGLAQDGAFSGVELLDQNGVQLGIAHTLNSNHQTTIGTTVVIPRGTTRTFTVAANRACTGSSASGCTTTSYAGQIASFAVVAVNSSATVNGSLPIVGASHTINETVSIGTAQSYVSTYDPNSTSVKHSIGDTAVKFAGVRITAGSAEAVRLWSITWNQSGSAGSGDLANVMVYVNGTAYPATVSTDGKYYTATFGSGVFIDKGNSVDAYIQGDVVGSSVAGRTVEFDIYKNTDIYMTGETYGYGVTVTPGGNTASSATNGSEFLTSDGTTAGTAQTPFFSASLITINPGSATSISRATSVAAQNIAVNVPNQVLGGFTTNFTGEPVSVANMTFKFNYSSGTAASSNLLTSVSIVNENGAVVAGPQDAINVGGTEQKVAFTDTVTFPTGMHTYTLEGKVPSTVSNNVTIVASTTPSSDWSNVTGQTSGNSVSLSGNGLFSMSTMTVKGPALAVTLSNTPASQNVVSGGQVTFANVQIDASQSGEDIRIGSVLLKPSAVTGLSSCQLWNGTTAVNTGSNVPTTYTAGSETTFNLDNSLVIPKGTIVTLALSCNVSSQASGSYHWDVVSADWSSVSATGVLSGNTLTTGNSKLTVTDATGGTMTIGSAGTLAATLDSSSPSFSLAANGSTGVTLGVLRFTATNEAINLNKVSLQLSNTSASSSPADLNQVTLWNGSTLVGTATFTGSSRFATSSLTQTVSIPNGGYVLLTVKGDIAPLNTNAGIGNNPKPGAIIQVNYNGSDTTGTQGIGVSSGSTINAPSTSPSNTAVAGVRVYKSWPIITYAQTSGNLTNGTAPLVSVTVNANSTGDVKLYKLSFLVATTSASLSSPTFTGPNGSVGTTAFNSAGTELTAQFDSVSNTSDATIAAGQSKTFTIGATVAGLTGSTAGVASFQLEADQGFALSSNTLMATTTTLTNMGAKIIWSPQSTTTAATGNNDWTNGYGLPGCFQSSGLGQNCFAATKSQ
jgi:hypothetical protein